jgi:Kef-type K+ transport system membrane component KefB/voltage-gated potassium channel Kch
MNFVYMLGLMIVIAAIFALIAKRLNQPLLLGYVLAGLVLGPAVTGIIDDPAPIMAFFAEFGLILLLFVIGLELDFNKIKSLGKMSIIIGTVQIIIITAVVFSIATLLGFSIMASIYTGLIVAFSSTLVVVKALSDKGELDTAHGGMILGILIVEDILAVVGLTILGAFASSGEEHHLMPTFTHLVESAVHLPHAPWFSIVALVINGAFFILVAYLFSKAVLPKVFKVAGSSTELLFVASFGVALTVAALGAFFSFSLSIGAFVAGIALSSSPFSHEIMGKVKPVKDFILVLFFVALGTLITFSNFLQQLKLILLLLVAAVLVKPIIIFVVRKAFRYNNRISFLISIGLAQISEFSLILAMAGVAQGMLETSYITGAVIATLVSMTITVYLIKYDESLHAFFKPLLAPVESIFGLRPEEHHHAHEKHKPQVVVIGVNNLSVEAIEALHGRKHLLVVEKNPSKIILLKEKGIHTLCTDIYNQDLYDEHVDFSQLETLICIADDLNANLYVIRKVRELSKKASLIVVAHTEDEGKRLYKAGATLVMVPEITSRRILSELIMKPTMLRDVGAAYYTELHKNFVFIREI